MYRSALIVTVQIKCGCFSKAAHYVIGMQLQGLRLALKRIGSIRLVVHGFIIIAMGGDSFWVGS